MNTQHAIEEFLRSGGEIKHLPYSGNCFTPNQKRVSDSFLIGGTEESLPGCKRPDSYKHYHNQYQPF